MSVVIPIRDDRRVVESSDSVDIKGSLNLLDEYFRIAFVSSLRIIIVFGLAEVRPFHEIDTVFGSIIARSLDSEHFIRVLIHLLIGVECKIKWRVFSDEVYGHGGPLDIQSMEHIVGFIVEFQHFSLRQILVVAEVSLLPGLFLLHFLSLMVIFTFGHHSPRLINFYLMIGARLADPTFFLFKFILDRVLKILILESFLMLRLPLM